MTQSAVSKLVISFAKVVVQSLTQILLVKNTGETTFLQTRTGNRQNCKYRSKENPKWRGAHHNHYP